MLKGRSHPRRNDFDNWFEGKVYCAECGHRLTINSKQQKNGMHYLFRCSYHFEHPDRCQHHHAISYSTLMNHVVDELKQRLVKTEINRADIAREIHRVVIGDTTSSPTVANRISIQYRRDQCVRNEHQIVIDYPQKRNA